MRIIYILYFLVILVSCDENIDSRISSSDVELYLLSEFETVENSCEIIESTVKINKNPLIKYDDIISYNKNTYTFIFSDSLDFHNKQVHDSLYKKAFAVTIGKEVIYTGYFWSSISSQSCNWIIIDLLIYQIKNELHIELGYPGYNINNPIPDNRNNDKLLSKFRIDHKLIE